MHVKPCPCIQILGSSNVCISLAKLALMPSSTNYEFVQINLCARKYVKNNEISFFLIKQPFNPKFNLLGEGQK